ncbi:FGGY-family carbohydrate kinase [Pseudanabaena biceps]|nr:FGGY-family carbohydrate kinase [Pseudanabaena biceps]
MKYYLGIDFGTSGVRAIAIDQNHEVVATSKSNYDLRDYATWKIALYEVIADLPIAIKSNIFRILIDGTSATVLLCDRDGKSILPTMIYSDACPPEVVAQVQTIAPSKHLTCSSTSSFAKLLTMLEQVNDQADDQGRSLYFLHQADWLGYLLHGKLGISDYHNALKLGYDAFLLNYPNWLQTWQAQYPLVILPEVLAPAETVGFVQREIAVKLGLPNNCAIAAGTTDSNAAFFACVGHSSPDIGTAVTSLGSTMVLKVLSDRPITNADYGIYSHRLEHSQYGCLWLVGGASNVGGAVLKQFFSDQQLQEISDRIDPNVTSSLDYYPLTKKGERFPLNDPHLIPRLDPRPDNPVDFLHGLLESMAKIEAQGYELLQKLGATSPTQIYTAGGGSKNLVWTKIRDRYLHSPMRDASQTEAAYGAALLTHSQFWDFHHLQRGKSQN